MSFAQPFPVIKSLAEARQQVERYQIEIEDSRALCERMSRTHQWYAIRSEDGGWLFAPSKFVGHAFKDARDYLKHSGGGGQADGRATEAALKRWRVEPPASISGLLNEALDDFVGRHGARRRLDGAGDEIWLLPDDEASVRAKQGEFSRAGWRERIVVDSAICHGRPRIAGTRIRITDILEMLAAGATSAEVLADFPTIRGEDISAVLAYAAHSLDHRVVQAAV